MKETLFKPGQSGNPAGKAKGTIHKKHLRQAISDFLDDQFPQVQEAFVKLKPKDKLKFYIDLLQYGAPRLAAINVSHDFKSMLTGTSDDELLQMMEAMILKRQLLNQQPKTIELDKDQYAIHDESQPKSQPNDD